MKFILQYLKKKTKLEPYERSCLQLISVLQRNDKKDKINTFQYTSKALSTMEEKRFIPVYAEHLHFLIKRAGWLVT